MPLFENVLYKSEFDLHEIELAGKTYFRMSGFAPRLVLTQGLKVARKWPVGESLFTIFASLALAIRFLKELQINQF